MSTIKQTRINWIEKEQKPGKFDIHFSWLASNIAAGVRNCGIESMSYKILSSASALK
jgi:hypothetical protein